MLKAFMKKLSPLYQMFTGVHELRKGNAIEQAREYERLRAITAHKHPDNIAVHGFKVYSQTDEDGIIAEIFNRIPGNKTFVEIGVQTGVECNSMLLLLKDWRGVWIEGSEAYCRKMEKELGSRQFTNRFQILSSFVDRENIFDLLKSAMNFLAVDELDFFSLDIDGNDLHCLKQLIDKGIRPKAVCVEYNGKFPPGVSVTIRYSARHVWDETDYMGSSLQALVDMMEPRGYFLVTCNIPGINAFFVRQEYRSLFAELDIAALYQPYRFFLSPIVPPQPPSLSYLKTCLDEAERRV